MDIIRLPTFYSLIQFSPSSLTHIYIRKKQLQQINNNSRRYCTSLPHRKVKVGANGHISQIVKAHPFLRQRPQAALIFLSQSGSEAGEFGLSSFQRSFLLQLHVSKLRSHPSPSGHHLRPEDWPSQTTSSACSRTLHHFTRLQKWSAIR